MTSTRAEKAWRWTKGLLDAAAPDAVSPALLEAILREVGYRDPYEVINRWAKEGLLKLDKGHPGDSNFDARRYSLNHTTAENSPEPSSPVERLDVTSA